MTRAVTEPAAALAVQAGATRTLRPHPQAALIPPMPTDQYRAFRDDIARRGIQTPLEITAANLVLDGHARLRAAIDLGVAAVPVRIVAPADEVEYMLLACLHRRQLTASQRAALALERDSYQSLTKQAKQRRLHNLRPAPVEVASLPPRGKTREIAAGWAGVSARTIQDAATVHQHDPALFERIKAGEIAADQDARQIRRQLRDHAIPPPPPIPTGPFQIIYADPPWQLGNPNGQNAPERHYPTLTLETICALHLPATADALLLLWTVNCQLPQALDVIAAWGFNYKTNLAWVKPSIGLGNWTRNRHELLLLATRGRFPLPDPDLRPDSVIEAPRRRHSQKPDHVYHLIEHTWPHESKLELFARHARPGWASWGNQLQSR